MRKSSESQLRLLESQFQLQVNPVLDIGFRPESLPKDSPKIENTEVTKHKLLSSDKTLVFTPILRSYTDQIVLDISWVHFDKETQTYMWSNSTLPVVNGKEEQELILEGKRITSGYLQSILVGQYGGACHNCVWNCLNETAESFIALFYRTSTGQPYLYKQPYLFDATGFQKFAPWKRQLFHDPKEDDTYTDYYAPK